MMRVILVMMIPMTCWYTQILYALAKVRMDKHIRNVLFIFNWGHRMITAFNFRYLLFKQTELLVEFWETEKVRNIHSNTATNSNAKCGSTMMWDLGVIIISIIYQVYCSGQSPVDCLVGCVCLKSFIWHILDRV